MGKGGPRSHLVSILVPLFEGGGSEVIFISNGEADAGSVWLHPVQDAPRRLYDSLGDAADAVRMALIDASCSTTRGYSLPNPGGAPA